MKFFLSKSSQSSVLDRSRVNKDFYEFNKVCLLLVVVMINFQHRRLNRFTLVAIVSASLIGGSGNCLG